MKKSDNIATRGRGAWGKYVTSNLDIVRSAHTRAASPGAGVRRHHRPRVLTVVLGSPGGSSKHGDGGKGRLAQHGVQ